MKISITRAGSLKPHPDESTLGFGQYFTDHMFLMDYSPDAGWHDARIVPYGPLSLDPASMVLHYGQEVFEGLKAYRGVDGNIRLFRARDNAVRFNRSCARLSAPSIPEDDLMQAMVELLHVEQNWVPHAPDTSLYLRPFVFATDPFLGVRTSHTYLFVIILSPVGSYYPGGMSPTSILVEDEDVRAARGGMGFAKTGANYAATIRAQNRAKEKGFTQVMWLDAIERAYVEEIGTSNAFFKLDGTVVTPPLGGTILPGVTRASCLDLLREWGIPTQERPILMEEVVQAARLGKLEESFASGTAAVISPIGQFHYRGESIRVGDGGVGQLSQRLFDTLTGIQWGKLDDPFGWTTVL